MSTGKHWKAVCSLPKYSFFKDMNENVCRVENKSGNWIEAHKAQEIVDNAETDIHELRSERPARSSARHFGRHRSRPRDR